MGAVRVNFPLIETSLSDISVTVAFDVSLTRTRICSLIASGTVQLYVPNDASMVAVITCVNVAPGVRSIYRWQGEVQDDNEWLLVIKSRRDLLEKLQGQLHKIHSYEVPEVMALSVVDGSPAYLRWLDRELAAED